ncbi:hypothetical protein Q5P01_002495 [Channa striata]|uniref:Ig-like domain-containing protein n=1 Tax=Channa striata TaxID=64152 RepID=A0AA88NQL1_CHASR|nr:hypothetical protein Q5P01_002495 [Channa striata]
MFLLLSCWIISGIMAEDPSVTYYQMKNSSVCLHVITPPPYHEWKWTLAEKIIVTTTISNPTFADKVDHNRGNHSLSIKELTVNDSGVYKFTFYKSNFMEISEKHTVVVEEHVPTPVIVMSVLHSNLSAGSCNISVNCSILGDWLWSFCGEDSCTTSQRSLNKVNITISTDDRTVVCSASNHVSESNVSESKGTTCFNKTNPEHTEESLGLFLFVIPFIVCLPVFAIIFCVAKKFFSTKYNQTSPSIRNQQVETQTQPEPRVSTVPSSNIGVEPRRSETDRSKDNQEPKESPETDSPKADPVTVTVGMKINIMNTPLLSLS